MGRVIALLVVVGFNIGDDGLEVELEPRATPRADARNPFEVDFNYWR